nr:hypothetical protein [Neokomagataea tanensis]
MSSAALLCFTSANAENIHKNQKLSQNNTQKTIQNPSATPNKTTTTPAKARSGGLEDDAPPNLLPL